MMNEVKFDRVFVEFMPNYEAGIYRMFEIKRKVKHNEKGAYIQYNHVKYYLKDMELVEDYGDFGCYKCKPKF